METLRKPMAPAVRSPLKIAAVWALAYIALCVPYIWFSGQWADAIAANAGDLKKIEAWKGTAFVLATGAMFFAMSLAVWRRIRSNEALILRQQQSLLAGERKAVAAMCAATMTHDLNNLLMCLTGFVDTLKAPVRNEVLLARTRCDIEAAVGDISQLATRIAAAAKDVLPEERALTDLSAAVGRVVSLARKHPDVRRCAITSPYIEVIHTRCNRLLLEEALLNIVINAAQAAGWKGHIDIRVARTNGTAVVQVHDDGPGISEDLLHRVFDPCFTTKASGSGLGLLAARTFALSHGGSISAAKSPLGGALFELRFPISDEPAGP